MTAVNGYYYYEGEKISYNENFNPFEPTDDCEKITIEKTDGNKYTVTHYEYYSGTWRRYDSENFYLEGNNMIPESMEESMYLPQKYLKLLQTDLLSKQLEQTNTVVSMINIHIHAWQNNLHFNKTTRERMLNNILSRVVLFILYP